jgi:hypothetical protein
MGPEQPIDPPDDYLEYSEDEMDELEREDEALYDESIDRLIDERNEF